METFKNYKIQLKFVLYTNILKLASFHNSKTPKKILKTWVVTGTKFHPKISVDEFSKSNPI